MVPFLIVTASLTTAALGVAARSSFVVREVAAVRPPSIDVVTDTFAVMRKSTVKSQSSSYLHSLRRRENVSGSGNVTGLAPMQEISDQGYITDLFIDGHNFTVLVDTGSSDTWVTQENFICVNENRTVANVSDCNFGPARFAGTPSGGFIAGLHLHIQYASGEFALGPMAFANVTVGGISVEKQEVALANYTYFLGDGLSSGLMGLGYPARTSAYNSTSMTAERDNPTHVVYDPVVTSMMKNCNVSTFSIAQSRNSSVAFLAFGGLPPNVAIDNSKIASTPIRMSTVKGEGGPAFQWYTIVPDAYVYNGSDVAASKPGGSTDSPRYGGEKPKLAPAIVDSGTTLMYLPTEVVDSVSRLFDPPAKVDDDGGYAALCSAKPPKFGVTIGGQTFWVSGADMLLQGTSDETDDADHCLLGIQDTGGDVAILGDTFLKNVVSIYDVGASEMRFAPLAE